MITRRKLLVHAAAAGTVAVPSMAIVRRALAQPLAAQEMASLPKGLRIESVFLRNETILRSIRPGSALGFTSTVDGRQFVSIADGGDFAKPYKRIFHTRVIALAGQPPNLVYKDLPGYPDNYSRLIEADYASYWGSGCLAVDGRLYQCVMASNQRLMKPDVTTLRGFALVGSKLIYSDDDGATWRNPDGSTPVVWEKWESRSRENMSFWYEPDGAFVDLTFLQMGRDYELNTDGYAYAYSTNSRGEVIMFRVEKLHILHRNHYEFFAGMREDNVPTWTRDISNCRPMLTIRGNRPPSVVYNAPLRSFVMAINVAIDGSLASTWVRPSSLVFLVGPTPWGPFTQVHEESPWQPGGDRAALPFTPQLVSEWTSGDGKSMWLAWCDYQLKGITQAPNNWNTVAAAALDGADDPVWKSLLDYTARHVKDLNDMVRLAQVEIEWGNSHIPYYGVNLQRVDLSVS